MKTNENINKSFDENSASLTEFNRELKRLASRKCRSKNKTERNKFEKEYKRLVKIKNERFETVKKSYLTYNDDEIKSLDLDTTIKAIKSLQSTRCLYPDRKNEVIKVETKYQNHKTELMDKIKFEELKAKFE